MSFGLQHHVLESPTSDRHPAKRRPSREGRDVRKVEKRILIKTRSGNDFEFRIGGEKPLTTEKEQSNRKQHETRQNTRKKGTQK